MPQFAYVARQSAGTASGVPTGPVTAWPYGWQYPGDGWNTPYPTTPISGGLIPGVVWPANWPVAVLANTAVVVNAPASITWTDHAAEIESYITVNGAEASASPYLNHLLQVTITEGGATRLLKKNGGAGYTTAIFYKVSNYQGDRYGFKQTIDFDRTEWASLDLIDIQVKLVTAVANPSGTDQWQVAYP